MIDVRLISRTHYQVSEPSYLTHLIRNCASPTNSNYRDALALRFCESVEGVNIAAAGYAVDLARSLKLLNSNLVWTDLGHLLNIVAKEDSFGHQRDLSTSEKVFFFRLFLEFDGAALIFLSRKLEDDIRLPSSKTTWANVAQDMFMQTYEEYLEFATDPYFRTHVRHLAEKRRKSPFTGNSGRHQTLLHINTLLRLGLVEASQSGPARVYRAKNTSEDAGSPTSRLLTMIPSIRALEKVVASRTIYDVVGTALGIGVENGSMDEGDFTDCVKYLYTEILATGINLCPIRTLCEALQIHSIKNHKAPDAQETILARLRDIQKMAPSRIRFHVDQYGYPAFLRMDIEH